MKTGPKLLLVVAALLIVGEIGYLVLSGPVAAELRPDDSDAVARGAVVYASACASCHGARLEGQPGWRTRRPDGKLPAPPHDATGHTWHHPDAILFELTKKGPAALAGGNYRSDMPGFAETLSDDQIIDVLSYIESTWPPSVRRRHDMINRRHK